MTAQTAAPITQDLLTVPRKLPETARTNIVGLTRDQLHHALIEAGTPERSATSPISSNSMLDLKST